MNKKLESGHGKIFLSQIVVPESINSNIKANVLNKVSNDLKEWGFNLSLPIACLSDREDQFILLTGLNIYRAAKQIELDRIWVFLIADRKNEAEKAIEQLALQSKLNERILEAENITEFLEFLNNEPSPLTKIRGIGNKFADKIRAKRPYHSKDDLKKLGAKQPLAWFKSYQEWKTEN